MFIAGVLKFNIWKYWIYSHLPTYTLKCKPSLGSQDTQETFKCSIFWCWYFVVLILLSYIKKSLHIVLLIMTFKATVGVCGHAAGPQEPGVRGGSSSHCYNPLQGVVLAPPEPARFYWSTQRAAAGSKNHLVWVRVSGTSAASSSQVNGEDLSLAKPACKTSKTKSSCALSDTSQGLLSS